MALGSANFILGETKFITMYLSAAVGTVTASSPLFSLWDDTGAPVSGLSGVAAVADPVAAIIKVQYELNSSALAPGAYYALLTASALTSADSATQQRSYDFDIFVKRVPGLP